jgi:hypothetical protein
LNSNFVVTVATYVLQHGHGQPVHEFLYKKKTLYILPWEATASPLSSPVWPDCCHAGL